MAGQVAYFRGTGGVVMKMQLPLDRIMAKQERKGVIRRVNEDGSPWREPVAEQPPGQSAAGDGPPPPEQPPAQSAAKADWVGYAVRVHGLTPDDAEALTKQDLVDRFGRGPSKDA